MGARPVTAYPPVRPPADWSVPLGEFRVRRTEEHVPVPDRPDLPPDSWISFNTRPNDLG